MCKIRSLLIVVLQSFSLLLIAQTYNIQGKNIYLYRGPSENSVKLVNEKATAVLGRTEYMVVDYSCKVRILDKSNDWVKIQIIVPDWLTATHIGWIPSKYIIGYIQEKIFTEEQYKILKTSSFGEKKNYHIYFIPGINESVLNQFVLFWRKKYSNTGNICIYDTDKVEYLIDVSSLKNEDYIFFADHFVAMSTFDSPKNIWAYPYQDQKYQEVGGTNWKSY